MARLSSSSFEIMETQVHTVIISKLQAGERLDKILFSHFQGIFSRTQLQNFIKDNLVTLNGKSVQKRALARIGDEIRVQPILSKETEIKPEPIPLDILYEDEWVIAINKPAGMVCHPALGNWTHTFVNALLHHCSLDSKFPDQLRPGIVHRLDKETSGVLIAAKVYEAHLALVKQFSERNIAKEYQAICLGNPGKGSIELSIGRHPVHRKEMSVQESGKFAQTLFETEAFNGFLSLVNLFPKTGRTHQLRVHMKAHGTPILGDPVYGSSSQNAKFNVFRQMLHAKSLEFFHPFLSKFVKLVAPFPEDMLKLIFKIKNS